MQNAIKCFVQHVSFGAALLCIYALCYTSIWIHAFVSFGALNLYLCA